MDKSNITKNKKKRYKKDSTFKLCNCISSVVVDRSFLSESMEHYKFADNIIKMIGRYRNYAR